MKNKKKLLGLSWLIIILTAVISVVFITAIKNNIRLETNLDKYMPQTNPAFIYSNQAEEVFGIKDGIIIAIENPEDIYNETTLQKIKDLTKEMQEMEEIDKEDVTSLYTADNIIGSDMGLEVNAFYSKVPKTPRALKSLQEAVESNSMIYGRVVSLDSKATVLIAKIDKDLFDVDFYSRILETADKYSGPENIYVAGRPIVEGTLAQLMPEDMKVMAPLVILIIVIALLLILRSFKAMILNLIVVLLSTIWSFGMMAVFKIPVYSVSTMIPVMLIAIGVAYGIHLFNHLNLYMLKNPGAEKVEAILDMLKHMWKPVMMAAITTTVGFTSLLTSEVYPVKYFGIFTAMGVFCAFLFAILLIPAALMITGLPKLRRHGKKSLTKNEKSRDRLPFAYRFTNAVLARKMIIFAAVIVVLVISIIGITRVWVDASFLANFEENSTIRLTDKFVNDNFAGTSSFNIILESEDEGAFKNPESLKLTNSLQKELAGLPLVGGTFSLTDFINRMNMVMNENREEFNTIPDSSDMIAQYLLLYEMSGDPETLNAVVDYDYKTMNLTVQLKSDDSKAIKEVIAVIDEYQNGYTDLGININYAGSGYRALIFTELILKGQVSSLALSVLIVIILLSLMFKSLTLGLIGAIPILLTAIINFGVMGLLNIPLGPTTALLSSIAVGIGIDYAIHFIENYREFSLINSDKNDVARLTMSHSGRAILFNAIVVISGFLVFLFSVFPPNRQLGALVSLNMFSSFAGTLTIMFLLLYLSNKYFKNGKVVSKGEIK